MLQKYGTFERIFNPESIAVIGVSTDSFGFGRGILLSLKAIGYPGKLYPVNPSGGIIAGLKIFRSIAEIPDNIDFAVIAVPANKVPDALESCRKKGAVGAEILSSGFSEIGTQEGLELENQIKKIAARGIRVLGPNCFGIYCPKSGLTMLPGPDLSRQPGPVSFISQSGGLSIDFAYMGKWRGIHFSKMISFGNGCDLRETEMLTYLRHDPTTRIICLYIEGVKDGRKFLQVLGETALEKPVIMLKGGLSESGTRAVTSHTASMGGNSKIWESALRQSNVVQVETLQEMADSALAFSMLPVQEYKGLTIVGGGGALGVNSADMAESSGFLVPYLRKDLQDKIRKILPQPGSSPANPIDIANPYVAPEIIHETIIHASEDENIDIHVMIQLLHTYKALATILEVETIMQVLPLKKLVAACSEAKKSGGKPIAMVLPNYKQEREAMDIEEAVREARALFITAEIPVFDQVKNALKAIASVSRYVLRRNAMISSLKN